MTSREGGPGDLIGVGLAFPLQIDAGGGIRLVGGTEELDAAINLILQTAPGERVMRPDFGCAMWEQVFAPVNPNTLGLIEQHVREALDRWEPRISVEQVDAVPEQDGSVVRIHIAYRVLSTNDHRNLVHPFYVIPQEEPAP
jgi:phage baseplate assembly protein W